MKCTGTLFAVLLVTIPGTVPGADAAARHRWAAEVGADALHDAGLTGRGVTVAVIGGPGEVGPDVRSAADGHDRLLAVFDTASIDSAGAATAFGEEGESEATPALLDAMLSSHAGGGFRGVAPNADLVLVRAFDSTGTARSWEIVRAINWVVANRERFGVRVLNLPIAARPHAGSPEDPLSRAVIAAWEAGIVVVAAAGNGGPELASIAAPGDLPRIITVGATAAAPDGNAVPGYSAAGPTPGGSLKPEILAPAGSRPVASELPGAASARLLSAGTSISSAVVSGIVALQLEATPWLTPDGVKYRLLAGARPIRPRERDALAFLRQGAGAVDAAGAVFGSRDIGPGEAPAFRGLVWSDLGGGDFAGSDPAARGFLWSDAMDPGLAPPESSLRGLVWSD